MASQILTEGLIAEFEYFLKREEKSKNITEKYLRDVRAFAFFANCRAVTKDLVIEYKNFLIKHYAVRSVNSMLASLNSLFLFPGWSNLRVKAVKLQREIYCSEEKELSREEYLRLVNAAKSKGNERLSLILQTICGTGIRVSELEFITVEAVKKGRGCGVPQGQSSNGIHCEKFAKKITPLCSRAKNFSGCDFHNTKRQADEPHQYLAGDENFV